MGAEADPFVIAIPIYHGVDLMDICAPYEIFSWLSNEWSSHQDGRPVSVVLVAGTTEPIGTRHSKPASTPNVMQMLPQQTFGEMLKIDMLFVPGGSPQSLIDAGNDADFVDFLRRAAETATWVCSVCEGALLLAQAGLLDGYSATTHWAFKACLAEFPEVTVVDGFPRYHLDGNRVTGGGISSGIDECLALVGLITGDASLADVVRKTMQYYPEPVTSTLTDVGCVMSAFGSLYPNWPASTSPAPATSATPSTETA